jgi:hypothetical protein
MFYIESVICAGLLHRLYSAEHVLDCAVMAIPLTGAKHLNSTLSLVMMTRNIWHTCLRLQVAASISKYVTNRLLAIANNCPDDAISSVAAEAMSYSAVVVGLCLQL